MIKIRETVSVSSLKNDLPSKIFTRPSTAGPENLGLTCSLCWFLPNGQQPLGLLSHCGPLLFSLCEVRCLGVLRSNLNSVKKLLLPFLFLN